MTNIEARNKARIDLIKILKSAGLLEGISLSEEELQTTKQTSFWHGVVRNEKVKAKGTYLTYFIPVSGVLKRADNRVFFREVTIAIDLFSKRSFDSDKNQDLLEILETVFTKEGYEVEFADEIFESDTSLFHYPMTIFKIY